MNSEIEKEALTRALTRAVWGSQVEIARVVWSKNPGREGRIWWPSYPLGLTERQKERRPLPRNWKTSEELAEYWASRPHLAKVIWGIDLPEAK